MTKFKGFVAQARDIRERLSPNRVAAFHSFLQSVRPTVRRRAAAILMELRRLERHHIGRMPTFDLFHILGIVGKENRYTDALAWLLGAGEVGQRFARGLLDAVVPAGMLAAPVGNLLRVTREVLTHDGRVDLVLEFDELAIAFEVKVWSSEHGTPGALPQTEAYPAAVQARLASRGRHKPAACVLLSPDGRAPLSSDAGRFSFVQVGAAILGLCHSDRITHNDVVVLLLGLHFIEIGAASHGGSFTHLLKSPLPENPDEAWLSLHLRDLLAIGDLSNAVVGEKS